MRIPLTKYGLPEVVVYPAAVAGLMVIAALLAPLLPTGVVVATEVILLLVLAWALMFFRDPQRRTIQDDAMLLAPADGRIADIETVDEKDFIGGPALRIGIFLSIFNTHINRAPCNAQVEKITYRPGKYLNAMNRLAGKVNESNNLALRRTERSAGPAAGPPDQRGHCPADRLCGPRGSATGRRRAVSA